MAPGCSKALHCPSSSVVTVGYFIGAASKRQSGNTKRKTLVWIGNMKPIKLTEPFCLHQSDSVSDPKLSPIDLSNLLDKKVGAPISRSSQRSHHVTCCCSDVNFCVFFMSPFFRSVHLRFRRIACAWLYI